MIVRNFAKLLFLKCKVIIIILHSTVISGNKINHLKSFAQFDNLRKHCIHNQEQHVIKKKAYRQQSILGKYS